MALPEPETPSFIFTIARRSDGCRRRMSCTAATMSSAVRSPPLPPDNAPRIPRTSCGSRLGTQVDKTGVRPVHRNAKRQSDIPLERCGVVGNEVAARRVRDQRPDLPEKPWPGQQLGAQRCGRRVADRDEDESSAGMAGNHAGEQSEVVLDDRFGHRLRGHVNHAQPWLTEQQQEEKGAFLHRLHNRALERGARC